MQAYFVDSVIWAIFASLEKSKHPLLWQRNSVAIQHRFDKYQNLRFFISLVSFWTTIWLTIKSMKASIRTLDSIHHFISFSSLLNTSTNKYVKTRKFAFQCIENDGINDGFKLIRCVDVTTRYTHTHTFDIETVNVIVLDSYSCNILQCWIRYFWQRRWFKFHIVWAFIVIQVSQRCPCEFIGMVIVIKIRESVK